MGCNVYGLERAKPLVVTYAPNDKACLTKILMERIVDPILSTEIPTLAARNTRHVIMVDGVGENLDAAKTLEDEGLG